MLYGISTAAYYGRMNTEDVLRLFADSGRLDCAEVSFQSADEFAGEFASAVLASRGELNVTSMHLLNAQMEVGLFSENARQRDYTLRQTARALDIGAKLGAKRYVFHGQNLALKRLRNMEKREKLRDLGQPLPPPIMQNYDLLAERVSPVVKLAAERGIRVAWETVTWSSFHRPEFAREMVKRMPDIAFTIDIKQTEETGYAWSEYLDAIGDRLLNVHVCDMWETGELCMPCEGSFDFASFAASLRAHGYDGTVILEPYPYMFTTPDTLFASLDKLRSVMGK